MCYLYNICCPHSRALEGFTLQDSQRQEFIRELLEDTDREFSDEELLHMLIRKKISADTSASGEKPTFGQRAADSVAKFAGSWGFIFSFLAVMAVWMAVNVLMAAKAFDAYPFILLNLLLSCLAAIQAPLIMIWNQWYAILPSKAVRPGGVTAAKRLGLELALFRTAVGTLGCVADRCTQIGRAHV